MDLDTSHTGAELRQHHAGCLERIAASKCRSSFAELFGFFAPRLKTYLKRLGCDDSSSEELAQEVMLTVWRKAGQYDRSQASPSTWIFRIARNRNIDALRRRRPELSADEPMLLPAEAEQPEASVTRAQVEVVVRAELNGLPPEQLDLLKAAFYEGLSHSEIAKRFDLPLGTVKSRIRLAFVRLRDRLLRDSL